MEWLLVGVGSVVVAVVLSLWGEWSGVMSSMLSLAPCKKKRGSAYDRIVSFSR